MAQVHGSSDPAFNALRDELQQRIGDGRELGAAICVNIDGNNVVDIWGGYANPGKTELWREDTLAIVWSCTKVVSALATLILVDRGLLDLDAPVAGYWPEFAVNGKENIKVSHILTHSAGIPTWSPPIDVETIFDLKKATKLLEQGGPPWWTPGEQTGYHMTNVGHYLGELVRRVTGKSLGQFIADEIASPLNADFGLGVAEKDWPRTAETFTGVPMKAEVAHQPGWRKTEVGAANGYSTARALARIGSIVSLGGAVDGRQYLSPDIIDHMLQERQRGHDLVLGHYLRFGLGVGLPVPQTIPYIPEGRVCFWSGWGGSMFIMDMERKMTISYIMNKMAQGTLGNENAGAYISEIYKVVDALRASSQ
ncbi:hypothetical protein N7512_004084 [Penicillium capsulatum]|nr:hypothetical protein N7512_004084 [Penicillium capsulatum]